MCFNLLGGSSARSLAEEAEAHLDIVVGLAFPTDPIIHSTPATWYGRLQDLSFVSLGITLLPAMIFLGQAFRNDACWRDLSLWTWITVALAIPAFRLKGLAFYVFLGSILLWNEIIAARYSKYFT